MGELKGKLLNIDTMPHHSGIQRELVRSSSSGLRSVGSGWEEITLHLAVRNYAYWTDWWNLTWRKWDHLFGKIECVIRYIIGRCISTQGLSKSIFPVTQSVSVFPASWYTLWQLPPAKLSGSSSEKWQRFLPQHVPGNLCKAHCCCFFQYNCIPKPDKT